MTTKTTERATDEMTHFYTMIVNSDNTYQILIDGEEKAAGSMYDDWDFELPKKIKDPSVSKPSDWVEEDTIVDPDAEMPEDWDEEDDGEWEAPMIPNPDYKGPWRAPKIDNPEYKGEWEHPLIDNPDYVEVKDVYKRGDIEYVGMEVWQVKAGTIFDNMLVTDDVELAKSKRDAAMEALKGEADAKEAWDEAQKPPEELDE